MKSVELQLEDEVAALLVSLAGSPRKLSIFITRLVREAAEQQTPRARVDVLATEVARLAVEIEALRVELSQPQETAHER